jgi:hypothetical protein
MSLFTVHRLIPASIRSYFPDPAPVKKVAMRTILAVAGHALADAAAPFPSTIPVAILSFPAAVTMVPVAVGHKAAAKVAEFIASGDVFSLAQGLALGALSLAGWVYAANWGDSYFGVLEYASLDYDKYRRKRVPIT